ncbi:MAG: hypothetical protein H0T79_07595 [Deltaproteobacteria bacterium]|nr:hypothetical protein [Deltaproteobacteria bacterium]
MVLVVGTGCREASSGEEQSRETAAPCEGCTLEVPYTSEATPLLVVLHGNHETAREAAKRWTAAASAKQITLLSLQCPEKRGCDDVGRWYRWAGDPAWIENQVKWVADRHAVDARRVYLVGWSGGASYIGQRAPEWAGMFAAVVLHGGGQPPSRSACPRDPLPAYFLVGDKNPAHDGARELRAWFERCKQPVEWDLIPGGDHEREEAALDTAKATAILGWLTTNGRAPAVSAR